MSTLVAQTISNGSVSTSSANVIRGSARAWVQFSGSTPVVNQSFNVSSVVRNSTGYYTVNLTNAMPTANYAIVGSSSPALNGSWMFFIANSQPSSPFYTTPTASSFTMTTSASTAAAAVGDAFQAQVAIFA
jgi:N-methylhydantoinase B/oxoprolinase/acetone carboxylase alpha subunit